MPVPTDAVIARPVQSDGTGSGGGWKAFRRLPAWYRGARWAIRRVAWRMRGLEYALLAVERELSSTVRVAWWRKPGLWRDGFLSESYVLYDLARNPRAHYLSDLDRSVSVRRINRDYGVVLDDKLVFENVMGHGGIPRPVLFGCLKDGLVVPVRPGPSATAFQDLLHNHRALVLKPARGGGGRDVSVVSVAEGGTVLMNGRPTDTAEVVQSAAGSGIVLVYEAVRQHRALDALFPNAVNTVRVLTMTDDNGEPFVARAVLRIGTTASQPTDNWIRGGLCAAVDLRDGALGRTVQFPANDDELRWHDVHPDTGAAISGTRVPDWDAVLETALQAARAIPSTPYVGWDLALSADGPVVIEGNSYSGVNLFQVHEPLLNDRKIRRFFERQGVI
ncbi:MAG: sugar-transfer associated ATP-grasp domain-containing protein [Alphaproteobacteria bacterium]